MELSAASFPFAPVTTPAQDVWPGLRVPWPLQAWPAMVSARSGPRRRSLLMCQGAAQRGGVGDWGSVLGPAESPSAALPTEHAQRMQSLPRPRQRPVPHLCWNPTAARSCPLPPAPHAHFWCLSHSLLLAWAELTGLNCASRWTCVVGLRLPVPVAAFLPLPTGLFQNTPSTPH